MTEIDTPRLAPRVVCEGPGSAIVLIGDGPIRPETALRLARDLLDAHLLATRPRSPALRIEIERP